jgi:hypothetical protein
MIKKYDGIVKKRSNGTKYFIDYDVLKKFFVSKNYVSEDELCLIQCDSDDESSGSSEFYCR